MNSLDLPALAISGSNCTATAAFAVALRTECGVQCAEPPAGPERPDLATMAQSLCAAAGVLPRHLRELRVDIGPGSYVGLRIAVTFARFLHAFGGMRLMQVTSLELLAAAALRAGVEPGATLHPVLDARRERLYSAPLRVIDGVVQLQRQPTALTLAELQPVLARGDIVLAAADLQPRLAAAVEAAGAMLRPLTAITADLLFAPDIPLREVTAAAFEPLYLMGSYAE